VVILKSELLGMTQEFRIQPQTLTDRTDGGAGFAVSAQPFFGKMPSPLSANRSNRHTGLISELFVNSSVSVRGYFEIGIAGNVHVVLAKRRIFW
jgi:hypothetical protein